MRRPFRRRPFRPGRPDIPPALRRANDLFASEDYPAAAQAFAQLARSADTRHISRAPQLYLRAGHAYILAGQTKTGMEQLTHGLKMIAAVGQFAQLQRAGSRVINELAERGLTAEVAEGVAFLQTHSPYFSPVENVLEQATYRILPVQCPGCGASIRSDEVEWIDDTTAECDYCGSSVRAE